LLKHCERTSSGQNNALSSVQPSFKFFEMCMSYWWCQEMNQTKLLQGSEKVPPATPAIRKGRTLQSFHHSSLSEGNN